MLTCYHPGPTVVIRSPVRTVWGLPVCRYIRKIHYVILHKIGVYKVNFNIWEILIGRGRKYDASCFLVPFYFMFPGLLSCKTS